MSQSSTAISLSYLLRCCSVHSIRRGRQAHAQAIANGLLPNVTLQTDLLLMYSRCGDFNNARLVFEDMPHRNMHSWNIMISSCVHSALYDDTLRCLCSLMETSLRPDHFTFPSLFKACVGIRDCWLGMALHNWVVKVGLEDHVVVASSMLDMYAKCGSVDCAHQLFVNMREKDAVVWNAMISGFARAGRSTEAIFLFREMQSERVDMDLMAVPSVISACGTGGDLSKGKEIHGKLIRHLVFDFDVTLGNSLLDMYAKCGCLDKSRKIFLRMRERNLVTWTTLICCCGLHGKGEDSLALYEEMLAQGLKPNCTTFTSVLSSCSHSGLIQQGQMIFKSMKLDHGIEPGEKHYACIVDLLGRCGKVEEALELIKNMPMEPTASVWRALLGACSMHKNVAIAEIAAHRLFDLEAGNSSNYIALCSVYDAFGMRDGVSKIRTRMKELGLVKMPGCSWITVEGRVFTFYQGDVSHPLPDKIYDIVEGLLKTMVFSEGYG